MQHIKFLTEHVTRARIAESLSKNKGRKLSLSFEYCLEVDSDALADLIDFGSEIELSIDKHVIEACLSDLCIMMRSGKVKVLSVYNLADTSATRTFLSSIEFSQLSILKVYDVSRDDLLPFINPPQTLRRFCLYSLVGAKVLRARDICRFLPYITALSTSCSLTPDAVECFGESRLQSLACHSCNWDVLVDMLRTNLTIQTFQSNTEAPPYFFQQIWVNTVVQYIQLSWRRSIALNQPRSKEKVCSRVVKGLRDKIGGDLLRPLCAMLFDL